MALRNRRERRIPMATATDPVCGMQVETSQAPAQSQYQGQTYYFCSEECKRSFDANPEQYVQQQA
jgi:YHS domain-containing protein